jgi:hypothetical protein
MSNLKAVELWMQAVIMHPGGVSEGVDTPEARAHLDVTFDKIEKVVMRSTTLSAAERLGIYNHAYFARLQECLRAEFPTLLHALGEKLFGLFTFDYLQHYPSRTYTLNNLARNFQKYLSETRPDSESPSDARESWPDFIIDLATFERAFNEVFDGPGVEGQQVLDADRSIQTTERFMETRFVPVVCLKLLDFRYPVNQYFTAVRNGASPALPGPDDTYLAMTRRDYIVRIHELTRFQYEVLSALVDGQTLGDLVRVIAKANGNSDPRISTVFAWINEWVEKGFFAAIER